MNRTVEPNATTSSSDAFAIAAQRLRAQRPLRSARLRKIALRLREGELDRIEKELVDDLVKRPDDADALYLAAQVSLRLGDFAVANFRLTRCLELAPDFAAASFDRASVFLRLNRPDSALEDIDHLLELDKENPLFRQLKASALENLGAEEQMLAIHEQLATENPQHVESWISYGNALRATGATEKSIAAYRRAIALNPSSGMAYWSLANLKTLRFSDADIASMQEQLKRADIALDDRITLQFALGKAFEDARAYERSWGYYAKANAARRIQVDHDPESMMDRVAANRALFSHAFLEQTAGWGYNAPDPIFVLGRPRSGSTLIEQILASHSAIEGTAELRYLPAIASRLGGEDAVGYPQVLATLDPTKTKALGEEYLEKARLHRKLGCPYFIDKNPANYWHVGMIHLILPNAKIIDARRNPAAVCLSMFKQNYSTTNLRLAELGTVYRAYVALMAHFDSVLPGRVHRVIYEDMVRDPESQVRRLLSYLGLPFEENCLRFYETKRAVLTPSSEQVRRPISADAVDHWKHYEPWLGPLIKSLGDVLTGYPNVPDTLCACGG